MGNPFSNFFGLFKFGSGKSSNSVLAVDIGSSSVKVVQLRNDSGRIILETYGELAVGPYNGMPIGQSVNLSKEKTIELLSDIIREANVTTKRASMAIPLRSSLLINMEVPEAARNDLANVVPMEARKFVPVPINEVALDWWLVPEIRNVSTNSNLETKRLTAKNIEILLVAIHRDLLKVYDEISQKLGVSLSFFEIETFSAIRSVMSNDIAPTVVLDLGAGTTKVAVVDYGVVRTSHTINKGAQDITSAISRSPSVSFDKAEEIKRKVGLVEQIAEGEILTTISPILEYIFSEVNRVIINYQRKNARAISKVLVIGGGAALKGLLSLAEKSFEVPVQIATPFDKVEYPAFLSDVLHEAGPVFAVSLGLALRALQDN